MGALIGLLPVITQLMNNPAVQALIPLLLQLGQQSFPGVDPNKAVHAATALFDTEHTKWVQAALTLLGTPVEIDGVYGAAVKDAVKSFQAEAGLVVDGWAGAKTNDALRAALLKKSTTTQVPK